MPDFMFEDVAPDTDHQLLAREEQWIFNLDGEKYYLLSSKRHFPLSFFQCTTKVQKMKWQVTRTTDSVHVGKLIAPAPGYTRAGPPRAYWVSTLGTFSQTFHWGKIPPWLRLLETSSSRLVVIIQPLLFRTPGWIHPPKAWWRDLILYVLTHFEEDLERLGLYEAVRATCYGIQMSVENFYAIF